MVVKGQVLDQLDQSPLSYASVGIFDANQTLRSGGITDDNGFFEFELSQGKFTLQIDYISYKTLKKNIEVQASESTP